MTDINQAAADALAQYGSQVKAAAALGLSRAGLQQRLLKHAQSVERCRAREGVVGGPPIPEIGRPPAGFAVARNAAAYDAEGRLLRQWVGTKRDAGDTYSVPDGHVVKGESVLVDPENRVLAKWVKTSAAAENTVGLVEGLQAAFAAYKGAAPLIAAPAECDEDLLTVYPLPDLHFGLYSWSQDAGDDWDSDIAERTILDMVAGLVAQSRPSKHAVVLGLGDYFHVNDKTSATPASKHQLDTDGRWPKIFAAGARLAVAIIDMVSAKHDTVEAVFLAGNHDPDAAVCLTVALDLFYGRNPRVTINTAAGLMWYRRFGKCLLGASHGHTVTPDRLAMAMANDRAADWGQTNFRHAMTGHIHRERAKECGGVRVESFGTPIPRDAWAQGAGFRSGRSLSALTFHATRGEIGRHRTNLLNRADAV